MLSAAWSPGQRLEPAALAPAGRGRTAWRPCTRACSSPPWARLLSATTWASSTGRWRPLPRNLASWGTRPCRGWWVPSGGSGAGCNACGVTGCPAPRPAGSSPPLQPAARAQHELTWRPQRWQPHGLEGCAGCLHHLLQVVSSTLLGAAVGSFSGGGFADTLGRRKSFMLCAIPVIMPAAPWHCVPPPA
jgi:hypothetical protein